MTYKEFIAKYEGELELTYTAELIEFNVVDESFSKYAHDKWITTWTTGRTTIEFAYRTGIGHRTRLGNTALHGHVNGGQIVKVNTSFACGGFAIVDHKANSLFGHKTPPHAHHVLECLASDAHALGQTFDDWASDLGYDTDSRKAEAIYNACLDTANKLVRLFGLVGLEELRNCTEE